MTQVWMSAYYCAAFESKYSQRLAWTALCLLPSLNCRGAQEVLLPKTPTVHCLQRTAVAAAVLSPILTILVPVFPGHPPHSLRDIDRGSDSPVDQNVEPSMEHQVVPPAESSQLIQDLPDLSREVEKLGSTGSDNQRPGPGQLTPPPPTIPACWFPLSVTEQGPKRATSPPSPSYHDARIEDSVRALSLSEQASSRSDLPEMAAIHSPIIINVPVEVPRRSHFSPSPATSIGQPIPCISGGGSVPPRTPIGYSNSHSRSSGYSHPPSPINITIQDPVYRPVIYNHMPIPAEVPTPAPVSPAYSESITIHPRTVISRPPSVASSRISFYPPIPTFEPYVPSRHREDGLWFEDGNLALRISNVEFRVYKGPLFALSPVLKGRCESIPTSSYLGSVGFTALDLWDTTLEDLRHVLRFVFGGTSRVEPSFSEISAHIRFGHNYKAEKLVQRSLDYLKKFYVSEINAWLQLPTLDPPFFEPVHAIGVVNLARLLGKDGEGLLPIALMRCCTLGAGIVEGYTREDGNREMLSPADLGRCFEGRVKLLEASVRAAETLRTHMTSDECGRPRRCKEALQRFVNELLAPEDSPSGDGAGSLANELRCLRWDLSFSLSTRCAYLQEAGAAVVEDEERELCPKCFVRQLEEQGKIFAKLPEMMGVSVEGWATKGSVAA